jgi:hypothetical protein
MPACLFTNGFSSEPLTAPSSPSLVAVTLGRAVRPAEGDLNREGGEYANRFSGILATVWFIAENGPGVVLLCFLFTSVLSTSTERVILAGFRRCRMAEAIERWPCHCREAGLRVERRTLNRQDGHIAAGEDIENILSGQSNAVVAK